MSMNTNPSTKPLPTFHQQSTPASMSMTGIGSESRLENRATNPHDVTIVNVTSAEPAGRFGSLLTSINKSVSSALNNLLSFQQQDFSAGPIPGSTQPTVGVGRTVSESNVRGRVPPPVPTITTTRPPATPTNQYPRSRSPSPMRDLGFSTAVSDIVDAAHAIRDEDRRSGGSFRRKGETLLPGLT